MMEQFCTILKYLPTIHTILLMENITLKFMQEFWYDISNQFFLINKRAYIGIYLSPIFKTLRAFKSLYFKLSSIVYFFVLKHDVFCLSVIPKISNCSGQYLSKNEIG